jgi:hypothetical protein
LVSVCITVIDEMLGVLRWGLVPWFDSTCLASLRLRLVDPVEILVQWEVSASYLHQETRVVPWQLVLALAISVEWEHFVYFLNALLSWRRSGLGLPLLTSIAAAPTSPSWFDPSVNTLKSALPFFSLWMDSSLDSGIVVLNRGGRNGSSVTGEIVSILVFPMLNILTRLSRGPEWVDGGDLFARAICL